MPFFVSLLAASPFPLRGFSLRGMFGHADTTALHENQRLVGDTMTVIHPPHEITQVQRVIRWFFSVPQWVQLGGILLAAIVAAIAITYLWKERQVMLDWLRHRHQTTHVGWKIVGAFAAVAVLGTMAAGGITFFTYSQKDNQFCLSCHTLHDEVFERFQISKHHTKANLRCHDCHDEPLVAEMTQVGKWLLLRPGSVGPHAPVPREVCANCHIKKDPDSTWQAIVATAGHSVHLTSDTAKKLKIDCITCHGVTAHRFVPAAQTCQQSGCHEKAQIRLGKMAGQTALHCTVCHKFTAPVSDTTRIASAREALVPGTPNCLSCHQMRAKMASFIPTKDPHKGECGACHDPHKQTQPKQTWQSCTNAGCHTRADTLTSFHRGLPHAALKDCSQCHQAHDWKVKGSTCLDCHQDIWKDKARAVKRTG